jgi:hypothetical protein
MVKRDQVVCGYLRKLRVRVRGGGCGLRKSHLRNWGCFTDGEAQGKARQESYSQGLAGPIRGANRQQGRPSRGPRSNGRAMLSVRDGVLSGASSEDRSSVASCPSVPSLKAASQPALLQ